MRARDTGRATTNPTAGAGAAARMRGAAPAGWRLTPASQAIAALLIAGGAAGAAQAQSRAFSPGWFADKGAAQSAVQRSGRLPDGSLAGVGNASQQQAQSRQQLQRSLDNLNRTAAAVAAQQAAQAARAAAANGAGVPDGLTPGGLWAPRARRPNGKAPRRRRRARPMAASRDHRADAVARHPELGQLQRRPKYHAAIQAERVRRGAEPRGGRVRETQRDPRRDQGRRHRAGGQSERRDLHRHQPGQRAQPGGRRRHHHRRAVPRQGHLHRCQRHAAHLQGRAGQYRAAAGREHRHSGAGQRRAAAAMCCCWAARSQRRPDRHAARSGRAGGG